ncbi:MAG TPA: hypothetical protein VF190_00970 [Rhodothermales bacterium]
MVTLRIGDAEREISSPSDIEEGWINRQIQVRRANGETVCAAVAIERPPVSLVLPVGDCPPGGRRVRSSIQPSKGWWPSGANKVSIKRTSRVAV